MVQDVMEMEAVDVMAIKYNLGLNVKNKPFLAIFGLIFIYFNSVMACDPEEFPYPKDGEHGEHGVFDGQNGGHGGNGGNSSCGRGGNGGNGGDVD